MYTHLRGDNPKGKGQNGPTRIHPSTWWVLGSSEAKERKGSLPLQGEQGSFRPKGMGLARGECEGPKTQKEDTEEGADRIPVSSTI